MKAYYHDNDKSLGFTEAHDSGESVLVADLEKIGVFYRQVTTPEELDSIASKRGYRNRDTVDLGVAQMGGEEAFGRKLDMFYAEHYHEDEEIRYIVDGEGYFDVRGQDDRWIRVVVNKLDLLVLPAGIYHRFTVDSKQRAITAIRLFLNEPKWEAIPRGSQVTDARIQYEKDLGVRESQAV